MRERSVAVLCLVAVSASAQTPASPERFYQAIRSNDLSAVRALVMEAGVDGRDAQGQTPLMVAAAFGSADAVRLLLAGGADVRAASGTGVTALHLAVTDLSKTRMLLDAGADVNAVSSLGRTPLIVAASANRTGAVVRLLLSAGAKLDVADAVGITPLIAAAAVDNREVAELLLARGADPGAIAKLPTATALMGAATNGNAALLGKLLSRRADANTASADSAAVVKNGPVQFGRLTALHFAALSGNPAVVRRLLDAGAAVDAADVRGMTPLMLAIATDRPDARIIRMLLQAGADPAVRSKAGESAVEWARKFEHPAVLAELKLQRAASSRVTQAAAAPAMRPVAAHAETARAAVERSLPLLREVSGQMLARGGCMACHAQPLTAIAVNLARARGWTTASSETDANQALTQLGAGSAALMQLREAGGLPDAPLYLALLLAADGTAPSRATDGLTHYLAAKQRDNGSWDGIGGSRAPMQDGNFSRTALSIRAFTAYATPARAAEYDERVRRAAAYLKSQAPQSTEDRVMQLLGLHWADAEPRLRQTRTRELLALQREDGGWGQTPYLPSDAYATGQALYTLRTLGVPGSDPGLQRGAAFLVRTQQPDGSWHVKNRAMKVQPYFDSGFPHEHDQWISHAGSAWAAMALAVTAPERPDASSASR